MVQSETINVQSVWNHKWLINLFLYGGVFQVQEGVCDDAGSRALLRGVVAALGAVLAALLL